MALIDTSYLIIFLSCYKTKKIISIKPFVWVCSLYQSTHTHPVPNGQGSASVESEQWESWSHRGQPQVFLVGSSWGFCPRFFAILFFFRQDSTGFSFATFRPILTNFDHDKKSKLSTLFDTDIYRQISTFPMSNFDKFRPSSVFDKFRPIPTNSLFFDLTLLLYADYSKSIHFFNRQIPSLLSFLFCDLSIIL